MLSLLRQRDFGLLWVGGLVSYLGRWAMFTALPVFVYERTGSALASALTFTATVAPMLLSSVAGVFVDRWNRKNTLVMTNIAMGVLTCSFLLAGPTRTWLVYVSMFCVSLAGLVVSPAENALVPTLVRRDQLVAANALNALNDNRFPGPHRSECAAQLSGTETVGRHGPPTVREIQLLVRYGR
jgi:MFS family permease